MSDFVHLHVHSHYSLFDGVATVKELVDAAVANGMGALALTDHGNMMGAVDFYDTATSAGIKPIIGLEAYVAQESRLRKDPKMDQRSFHLTLLTINEQGFKNLMAITSDAHLRGFYYKPRTDIEFLAEHSQGLIALSGCPQGEIPNKYLNQGEDAAKQALFKYLDVFGKENFFIEIQSVGVEGYDRVVEFLVGLAADNDLKLVATNDVHFITRQDAKLQEILFKINKPDFAGKVVEQIYFRSSQEMQELFASVPGALSNTVEIAERAQLSLDLDPSHLRLPEFPIPQGHNSPDDYLRELAVQGLRQKFPQGIPQQYLARLEHELEIIKQTGFASYFLIIWDIVKMAKQAGVPIGPGRGSGAASLVIYSLGITQIDPIKNNLLFERFLNPERVSPPDVDLDFSDTKRDRVIKAIRERYGENSVAQIITYSTLKARAAVKDVARVNGIKFDQVDRITKLIPHNTSISEALRTVPELAKLVKENPDYQKVFNTAQRLEGHIRNTSVHAAGVVITPGNMWDYVPLSTVNSGTKNSNTVVTQFDMESLEKLGILKVDVLGLRTLSVVERCLDLVKERRGVDIKLSDIPLDDPKTFDLLSKGNTGSVFQLESPGMRRTLRELKPSSISDIFAVVALYRTGPLVAGMTDKYIKRKNGKEPVEYPFKEVEEILKDTYGVVVYQEQVMQISMALSGFSVGQADVLRKAVGKKKPELMAKVKSDFIQGAVQKGHDRAKVEQLWDGIEEFAGYSFNRAHATSYGLLAYWTGFLKANYPAEFLTAALNASLDGSKAQEKVPELVDEAKRMGLTVLRPDINKSQKYFTLTDDKTILYGLAAIKNVGTTAIRDIVKARENGPFTSLEDFIARSSAKITKRVTESLIKAGAFDGLNPDRQSLLEKCEKLHAKTSKNGTGAGGGGLFVGMMPTQEVPEDFEPNPEVNTRFEKEVLGFYLTSSPLDKFPGIKMLDVHTSSDIIEAEDGQRVRFAGVVLSVERRKSKKGNFFATLEMEDFYGRIKGIIFSDPLKKVGSLLNPGEVLVFTGRVIVEEQENQDNDSERQVKVSIFDAVPVEKVLEKPRMVMLHLDHQDISDQELQDSIKRFVQEHPGNVPIAFELPGMQRPLVSRAFKINPAPGIIEELRQVARGARVGLM